MLWMAGIQIKMIRMLQRQLNKIVLAKEQMTQEVIIRKRILEKMVSQSQ